MRRVLSIAIGCTAGALAAGLTIALFLHGAALRPGDAGWFATWTILAAGSVAGFAVLPFAAAVALAETRGLKSVLWWLALGAALGIAAHLLVAFTGDPGRGASRLLAFLAAGVVGGFVYWAVAGRNAGAGSARQGRTTSAASGSASPRRPPEPRRKGSR
jgi:hypothetical protein